MFSCHTGDTAQRASVDVQGCWPWGDPKGCLLACHGHVERVDPGVENVSSREARSCIRPPAVGMLAARTTAQVQYLLTAAAVLALSMLATDWRPPPHTKTAQPIMLPFLEVSHLPSSSSFYSAITQPLGLRYISAGSCATTGSPTLSYGFAGIPAFELRQVLPTSRPLKMSRVVLSASSPAAVGQFRALVQRSKDHDRGSTSFFQDQAFDSLGYPSDRTVETDLDGNVMEVVYVPPPGYPEDYSGSTVRRSQSSHGEVSRILNWSYDVVVSDPNMPLAAPRSRYSMDDYDSAPVVRRSVTSTRTTLVEPMESMSLTSPRQNSDGSMSTSTVVGALLGVAAAGAAVGAGVAYGVMKHDRSSREEPFEAPPFQRRSTFPEPYPPVDRYSSYGPSEKDHRPAPSHASRQSYRPSIAPSVRPRSEVPTNGGRTQLLLTHGEHRSEASSRLSARTQDLEDMVAADYRSHAGSKHTSASRSQTHAPSLARSNTFDVAAAPSYVSARSHKTASTVRPAAPQRQYTEPSVYSSYSKPAPGSKAPSGMRTPRAETYVSSRAGPGPSTPRTASRISARDLPPASHAGGSSRVSARHVGLPRSGVGSSHAGWEKEDDLDSIAPSDSISCVGSRGYH